MDIAIDCGFDSAQSFSRSFKSVVGMSPTEYRNKKIVRCQYVELKKFDHYLLCGTVDGQLLLLDRETMLKEKKLNLSKKNIRSLYLSGTTLFAACQDKKLFKIDLTKFEFSLEQH